MEAVIKLSIDELTPALISQIKAIASNGKNIELTITIKDKPLTQYLFEDDQEPYEVRLNKSIEEIENNRNLVSFTAEEFEKFAAALSKK